MHVIFSNREERRMMELPLHHDILFTRITFRYQVYEPEHLEGFNNNGVHLGFRPENPGPYGRPPYQANNGVLVGPGGPTGIIGRYLLTISLSFISSSCAFWPFEYFSFTLISIIN